MPGSEVCIAVSSWRCNKKWGEEVMELQISSDTSRLHFGFHQKQVNLVRCQSKQSIFTTLFFPVLNLFFELGWGLTHWVLTTTRLWPHSPKASCSCCTVVKHHALLWGSLRGSLPFTPLMLYPLRSTQSMRSPGLSCPGISCGIFCSSVPKSPRLQPAALCANELG